MSDFIFKYILPAFACIYLLFFVILGSLLMVCIWNDVTEEKCIREDVDCDGEVTVKDLLKIQKYILERNE